MSCLICQNNENLYDNPLEGFFIEMHQTHSKIDGDTTTNYHSIDKVDAVRFQICRDCLLKKVRNGFGVFILLNFLCVVLSIIGITAAPVIGGGLSVAVLMVGGLGLFFLLPPLVKRIIAGTQKRYSFYIWELASEKRIKSPGFLKEIQKTGKIDHSNDRELIDSKVVKWVIKWVIPGIIVFIFIVLFVFWLNSVPDITKTKPLDNSVNIAYLYVQADLTLVSFNGKKVKRSADFGAKAAVVNIPEGEHTLVFDYKSSDGSTIKTAKGFEITITFESGKFYTVNYKVEGSNIRVYLRPTEEGVYLISAP